MSNDSYPNQVFSSAKADVFLVSPEIAKSLQRYLLANQQRLAPFEPLRSTDYYELSHINERIHAALNSYSQKQGISLVFTPAQSDQIIGVINYSGFMYGVFQAGYLGFSIDAAFEGQGIMTDVLQASLKYVQQYYGLHRIMANHLPDNERSASLLHKLGFEREGYAKSYLKINGQWQDHVLNALVFDDS